MIVLVFDTETSGLPKCGYHKDYINTNSWPFILQLAYILYDTNKHKIIKKYKNLIKIDDSVEITQDSIKIHNITRELCQQNGELISKVLRDFNKVLMKCDIIVGHNIQFDKTLIMAEMIRNQIPYNFNKTEYCTMKNSINLCKLEGKGSWRGKNNNYKYPKLSELVYHLFSETPENLHDALTDVVYTLKCYVKMEFNKEINI
jgi:DNA polymerase III epsilon subunit-like protein